MSYARRLAKLNERREKTARMREAWASQVRAAKERERNKGKAIQAHEDCGCCDMRGINYLIKVKHVKRVEILMDKGLFPDPLPSWPGILARPLPWADLSVAPNRPWSEYLSSPDAHFKQGAVVLCTRERSERALIICPSATSSYYYVLQSKGASWGRRIKMLSAVNIRQAYAEYNPLFLMVERAEGAAI